MVPVETLAPGDLIAIDNVEDWPEDFQVWLVQTVEISPINDVYVVLLVLADKLCWMNMHKGWKVTLFFRREGH